MQNRFRQLNNLAKITQEYGSKKQNNLVEQTNKQTKKIKIIKLK